MMLISQVTSFVCVPEIGRTSMNSQEYGLPECKEAFRISQMNWEGIPNWLQAAQQEGKPNPSNSKKHKMVSFSDPIPKKNCHDAMHCISCKKHWGTHTTHNTSGCHKYEKDGTHKNRFGKGPRDSICADEKSTNSYAQLSAKIAKLEKVRKKLNEFLRSINTSTRATLMTPTPLEGASW